MNVDGRVALVTGAGRRLGRAIAEGLGARGARVAVHYNASRDGAEATAAAIREAGGEARLFGADLADADAPPRLVADVVDAFGRLDVVVNSASVFLRTPLGQVTAAEWDTVLNVNLRAPFFVAQAAAAAMGTNGGVILNLADHLIYEPGANFVPHAISKAGVVQMTQALAALLAPHVRVNAVCPGAVLPPDGWSEASRDRLAETTPLRRLGTPDDIVQAILYLVGADYVTGETLVVDGGRRIRKAARTAHVH